MPPKCMKVCPKCSALVSVKLSVCACGHCFAMKQKAVMKTQKVAMKCLRAFESDNDKLVRQRNDRLARALARLCETEDQLMKNKIKT